MASGRSLHTVTVALSFLVVLVCLSQVQGRKNWALLIAGSNGYYNYRHQADICHAYHIMHKNGIPDENIVVMMYDDIANSDENPIKGNIINHPDGPNVYPNTLKDYTGEDVNAQVFLAVLQGNKDAVRSLTGKYGKVIDSGPDDYIFVYFADHGAPGILAMPSGDDLKATDVNQALKSMFAQKKYAKLVFYVEACESGSIFETLLPTNINVYATTAANSTQSSYACYYDKTRETYLGDEYSVRWMEDTDLADVHDETLEQQYRTVKEETKLSNVQQFGDLKIDTLTLDAFFGNSSRQRRKLNFYERPTPTPCGTEQVASEMVPLKSLKLKLQHTPMDSPMKPILKKQLRRLHQRFMQTHQLFWDVARTVHSDLSESTVYDLVLKHRAPIKELWCYYSAIDAIADLCPGLKESYNDFALRKYYVLVNLCNTSRNTGKVISAIETAVSVNPICLR